MRSLLLSAVTLLCVTTSVLAIEVSVGPSIAVRGTVNTVDPGNGLKTGFAFNSMPDLGLTTRFLFSSESSLGLTLDIEATGYSYIMRRENEDLASDANTYRMNHSCITIAPSLFLSGLQLGIGYSLYNGQTGKTLDDKLPWTPGTQASSVLEARIGAMIPVMRSKTGDLNLIIRASYMLDGHYTGEVQTYPLAINTTNPQSAGVSLGLNYVFHVVQ